MDYTTLFNTKVIGYVLQCGFLSDPFDINRGCRQGDPISSFLFIFGTQILQILISIDERIKGIKINDKIKHTQCTDDTRSFGNVLYYHGPK